MEPWSLPKVLCSTVQTVEDHKTCQQSRDLTRSNTIEGRVTRSCTMEIPEVHITYIGYVQSREDAHMLLDACLQGLLPQVPRRLRGDEQEALIRSGSIFIYNEHASNIKRWTDGRSWTRRRSLGEFDIYHELEKKKGSMPKVAGLVRKTVTLTRDGASYRVVSYFTEDDVQTGILATPSSCIQPGHLGFHQEVCSDSQYVDNVWEQLLEQHSPTDHPEWAVFHPRSGKEENIQFDRDFWLDLEDGIQTEFTLFEL